MMESRKPRSAGRSVSFWQRELPKRGGKTEIKYVDDVRELAGIFRRAGLNDKRLRLVIDEGASHNESAWANRFPEALAFLFGK